MQNPELHKSEESLPKSLVLAQTLEETSDEEEIKEKLGLLLDSISEDLGVEFISDATSIYRDMQMKNCLARVERLSRVLGTMETGEPMHISDENEYHYANAVVPIERGIDIAFSEGQAPGPVRTMIGFGKTIIGFKTENLSVEEIDFPENDLRNAAERKHLCRHVSGDLKKDDVHSLVMRIPTAFLDEKHLSSAERTSGQKFVFRGMLFNKN